jgi:predicted nuclease of predicted toxin-antitoxin system
MKSLRFLADMGISRKTVQWLHDNDFDAVHLLDQGLERMPDNEIMIKAKQENRVVLTMDLDFGFLLAVSKEKVPSVIIFRLSNETSEVVNNRLKEVLSRFAKDLESGAILSVGDRNIRVRRLPI